MQFHNEIKINKSKIFKLLVKTAVISITLSSVSLLSPATTNAGLFSFLKDAGADQVSAKTVDATNTSNSQNMLVLQATVNSDPISSVKSKNDAPLVSGNVLMAEIGPAGTVSDIEDVNTNTQISLYVVHDGDTLSKIAGMFKVSVNTIIWANDLNRSVPLKEGQKLIILPISGIKYEVKKGDTLRAIVDKYRTDLNELLQYNDLSLSSMISPGDIIVIPDAEPNTINASPAIAKKKYGQNPLHDADGPYYPGYFIKPIDTGYESQGLHGYNAVDLAASVGTPIHASAEGTVIASAVGGWNGGYGNYVIISHANGSQTLYAHTLKNYVRVGDRVEQGQMIAKIGMTGKTTGPHVHFEIRGARNPF